MVEYRRQLLDLTPSDMETEIQRDKFPSIAVSSLSGRLRSNLNVVLPRIVNKACKFHNDRLNDHVSISNI